MDYELLIVFIVLNIVNVIIQTVKSIATIKCGKWAAALVNAVAYGLYTYVIFFTSADGIDLHAKALITAFANLVGVYVVKFFEEKARKDKLWKVELTIPTENFEKVHAMLRMVKIPHNYVDIEKYVLINCYCATQNDSTLVRNIVNDFGAKYFVSESKTL